MCATFCLPAPVFNLGAGVLKVADVSGDNHCPILQRVSCDQDIGVLVGAASGPQHGPELGGPVPDGCRELSPCHGSHETVEGRELRCGALEHQLTPNLVENDRTNNEQRIAFEFLAKPVTMGWLSGCFLSNFVMVSVSSE